MYSHPKAGEARKATDINSKPLFPGMSLEQQKLGRILSLHSVVWRFNPDHASDTLLACEGFTLDGEYGFVWVEVKLSEVRQWLGY